MLTYQLTKLETNFKDTQLRSILEQRDIIFQNTGRMRPHFKQDSKFGLHSLNTITSVCYALLKCSNEYD